MKKLLIGLGIVAVLAVGSLTMTLARDESERAAKAPMGTAEEVEFVTSDLEVEEIALQYGEQDFTMMVGSPVFAGQTVEVSEPEVLTRSESEYQATITVKTINTWTIAVQAASGRK